MAIQDEALVGAELPPDGEVGSQVLIQIIGGRGETLLHPGEQALVGIVGKSVAS